MKYLLILSTLLCGCRFAAYQTPEGTRVVASSVLTSPEGSVSVERSPTTQKTTLHFKSTSNAEQATELLKAIR